MTSPASFAAGKVLDRGSVSNDRYITEGRIRARIANRMPFPRDRAFIEIGRFSYISPRGWRAAARITDLLGQFRRPFSRRSR